MRARACRRRPIQTYPPRARPCPSSRAARRSFESRRYCATKEAPIDFTNHLAHRNRNHALQHQFPAGLRGIETAGKDLQWHASGHAWQGSVGNRVSRCALRCSAYRQPPLARAASSFFLDWSAPRRQVRQYLHANAPRPGSFYQVEFYGSPEPMSEDCLYLNLCTAASRPPRSWARKSNLPLYLQRNDWTHLKRTASAQCFER
jgi:hypothetical protein